MIAPVSRNGMVASLWLLLMLLASLGMGVLYEASELGNTRLELATRESELELLKRRNVLRQANAPDALVADPFLEGQTLSLAANALQQRIVGLVEETGGKLASIGVEPPSDEPQMRARVLVQATADMTVDALQTLLFRLESGAPFIFVESLSVQRLQDDEAKGVNDAQRLHVDLRVTGYQRAGDAS